MTQPTSLVAEPNVTIEILKPLNKFLGCEIIFGDGLAGFLEEIDNSVDLQASKFEQTEVVSTQNGQSLETPNISNFAVVTLISNAEPTDAESTNILF